MAGHGDSDLHGGPRVGFVTPPSRSPCLTRWPGDYRFAAVERNSGYLADLEDFILGHRTPRLRRSVSGEPTAADRAIRTEDRTAISLHLPRARRGGRVDLLCAELPRFVPARRHLRGP